MYHCCHICDVTAGYVPLINTVRGGMKMRRGRGSFGITEEALVKAVVTETSDRFAVKSLGTAV